MGPVIIAEGQQAVEGYRVVEGGFDQDAEQELGVVVGFAVFQGQGGEVGGVK